MDESIEELRAQRESIKKHLEWLDRKLADAEAGSSPKPSAVKPLEAAKEESQKTPNTPADEPTPSDDKSELEIEAKSSPPLPEPDPEQLVAPVQSDIKRATTGCIIFFVLASALFIFLLFGLPYLMD